MPRFCSQEIPGSEPPPESEDEVKLWSSQQGGALGGFGLVSDLVELADWGLPGACTPSRAGDKGVRRALDGPD